MTPLAVSTDGRDSKALSCLGAPDPRGDVVWIGARGRDGGPGGQCKLPSVRVSLMWQVKTGQEQGRTSILQGLSESFYAGAFPRPQ